MTDGESGEERGVAMMRVARAASRTVIFMLTRKWIYGWENKESGWSWWKWTQDGN
jgi:hypothetical protein